MAQSSRRALQEGVSRALLEWVKTWDEAGSKVRLNAVLEKRSSFSLVVAPALVTDRFIDGTAVWEIPFALAYVDSWSDGIDGINAAAAEIGERWLAWISDQYQEGNVPQIDGAEIELLEPVEGVPTLAMAYPDARLAKYQFQAHMRVHY